MNSKIFFILISFIIISCDDNSSENTEIDPNFEIPDWTQATHGKNGDRNYEIVFPQNTVNRIDIKISKKNWQKMMDDMEEKYGPFGSGMGPPNSGASSQENPIWVPSDFYFNGKQWYQVGVRFKGNSTIRFSWNRGVWKIPLKFDFDEFEDDYPQIDNQRFYGFKQLSMSSNAMDPSLLREKVSADVFRSSGIPAAQTAFYRVFLDRGNGQEFWGIYTCVEEVDDTVIESQFISDNGNLYKPTGQGATFAKGSFSNESFSKHTNEDDSDWSDIIKLFEVLHRTNRLSESDNWRDDLEAIFRTDIFLKWLATNSTIQNWDSYGKMSQNYYLYNDPKTSKLTWIPWDHNEAMINAGRFRTPLSLGLNEVGDNWPLIRFLLDDKTYLKEYRVNLKKVIDDSFSPQKMIPIFQKYHALLKPFIEQSSNDKKDPEVSPQQLDQGLSYLINHVNSRYIIVNNFIN